MSELKAYNATIHPKMKNACDGAVEVYLKSEADKVIADLEESYKKEVEQLLIEIVELKDDVTYWKKVAKKNMDDNVVMARQRAKAFESERHQKYKRCLDKAEMCQARYDEEDAKVNGHYSSWDYTSEEMKYWERWQKRWLTLAEKFEEVK